ncbi:hypothetical protein ACFMPD_12855 [Sedimentitalea sp. HM32M-2]|uniref:hypothetical protein n=1 Tax=Sedimentitalea sp. HM32M-2 TaxID=3351566 RepID=UPI00362A7F36
MIGMETAKLLCLSAAILLALALDHAASAPSGPAANAEQIACECQTTACAAGAAAMQDRGTGAGLG